MNTQTGRSKKKFTMIYIALLLQLIAMAFGAEDFLKGHLQPFGHHRPPDVIIDDLYEFPDPQTFWDEYVSKEKAAVFRGAAARSPGFTLWTEEYLRDVYGDLEIRLEGKHERNSGVPVGEKGLGRDTLRSFLKTFRERDTYIISQMPDPMYKDFLVPPSISCGNMRDRVIEIDLWMSSGNTQSIIHKDAFNTFNCLMKGTKYWKLIEHKYEKWLYKTWEPKREVGGNSRVDHNSVDLIKFPNIAKVRWSNITINAGDCLFLPKSYYHQVYSTGDPNMAASILFSRIRHFDDKGCNETNIDFTPLTEVDVLWKWPGQGVMTMGNMDVWTLKENYLNFANEHGEMTEEDLRKDMMTIYPEEEPDSIRELARNAWSDLDKSGKGFLTVNDINGIDVDSWRSHSLSISGVHPSNTYEFEYAYIPVELIEDILEDLMASSPGEILRSEFIKQYIERAEGTEKYGNEIFDGLAGASSNTATHQQIRENMDVVLQKWIQGDSWENSSPAIDDSFQLSDVRLLRFDL